jgi:hypothetical protein
MDEENEGDLYEGYNDEFNPVLDTEVNNFKKFLLFKKIKQNLF